MVKDDLSRELLTIYSSFPERTENGSTLGLASKTLTKGGSLKSEPSGKNNEGQLDEVLKVSKA